MNGSLLLYDCSSEMSCHSEPPLAYPPTFVFKCTVRNMSLLVNVINREGPCAEDGVTDQKRSDRMPSSGEENEERMGEQVAA